MNAEVSVDIGNLKKIRMRSGISQHKLAKIIGISAASYNRKEKGLREFTLIEARNISLFFKLPIDKIFFN